MIVERAVLKIKPGEEEQFEAAIAEALQYPEAAGGFRSMRLYRGIESPSTYVIMAEWDSVEDHVDGFRASPAFADWRALIGPHFAEPPDMEHFTTVI